MFCRATSVQRRGFSLLELIAVAAIVALVATLAAPSMVQTVIKAREKTCFHNRAVLNAAVERYALEEGELPDNIGDLEASDYFPEGISGCPVSGNAYTLHNVTKRVIGHTGAAVKGGGTDHY